MDKKKLINNVKYLVNKYLDERNDLVELIIQDSDSVKYILSEISNGKKKDYDKEDLELIKDISFCKLFVDINLHKIYNICVFKGNNR